MTKVFEGGVLLGYVEPLGNKFQIFSYNHNMRELFGRDVFSTEEDAVQFIKDLNREEDSI